MAETPLFVGIDVAKAQLDVAVRPSGPERSIAHTEGGIAILVEQVRALHPSAVVLEATGDLELPLVSALAAAGLPVHVSNPRQVREFARATGRPLNLRAHRFDYAGVWKSFYRGRYSPRHNGGDRRGGTET